MGMGRRRRMAGMTMALLTTLVGIADAQWYSEKGIREMRKNARAIVTLSQASVRLDVHPKDALVFVDGNLAGTVRDYNGRNKRLYLFPGKHTIELRDPNYETFSTDVNVLPEQDFRLKIRMNKRG